VERGKEAILEHYAMIAPEALDSLNPEERRHLYRMLRLKAVQHPDGTLKVELSGIPEPVLVRWKIPQYVLSNPPLPAQSVRLLHRWLAEREIVGEIVA
jgi:hypothetical protein